MPSARKSNHNRNFGRWVCLFAILMTGCGWNCVQGISVLDEKDGVFSNFNTSSLKTTPDESSNTSTSVSTERTLGQWTWTNFNTPREINLTHTTGRSLVLGVLKFHQTVIVRPPRQGEGIIMVVESLDTYDLEALGPNKTCKYFVEVTQHSDNKTAKLCGYVFSTNVFNKPFGLYGPRTSVFVGEITVKARSNSRGAPISGKLVFTAYKNCSSNQGFANFRSCGGPSNSTSNHTTNLCIASGNFCNGYSNCGNASGAAFNIDELNCPSRNTDRNLNTRSTKNITNYKNNGGTILIPYIYSRPSYSNPYNPTNFKPSSNYNPGFSGAGSYNPSVSKTWTVPKVAPSPGISSSSRGIGKASGKAWKFIVGGVFLVLGAIGSVFGCKKKSEGDSTGLRHESQRRVERANRDEEEADSAFLNRTNQRQPGGHPEIVYPAIPLPYISNRENNIAAGSTTQDKPPSYQEIIQGGSDKCPPPYSPPHAV